MAYMFVKTDTKTMYTGHKSLLVLLALTQTLLLQMHPPPKPQNPKTPKPLIHFDLIYYGRKFAKNVFREMGCFCMVNVTN